MAFDWGYIQKQSRKWSIIISNSDVCGCGKPWREGTCKGCKCAQASEELNFLLNKRYEELEKEFGELKL